MALSNFKLCTLTNHIDLHMLVCKFSRSRSLVKVKGHNFKKNKQYISFDQIKIASSNVIHLFKSLSCTL